MRRAPLACLALACFGVGLVGASCTEQFPEPTEVASIDAGPAETSNEGGLESAPPPLIPAAQQVNASSSPVVFDGLRGNVWTANGDVGTVSTVDPASRALLQEIIVGQDVTSVAISPDGAWVAAVDRGGGTVSLIDPDAGVVRRSISVGTHPRACVWDAANPRWLYVAVEDDAVVAVIDRTAGEIAGTIPVLRRPSGLAVSATASQLYVTHRIDGDVTFIDTKTRAVVTEVPLADEPYSGLTVPNGKPLGFESLAITPDGARAWIPHELLAPTHPIVFNETLFPAISVVNIPDMVEQESNPNSINIDGRKNLFDAINLIGPDGQPDVFSQICAVAMHPIGFTAWALACASEDLLIFDVNQGIATDVVRNIPGDHPVGLALDSGGQRIFVLSDQSHTLETFDTDGGALIGHTQVYGTPITLVGKDPVDPQLRAGLTLFFRANPLKGPLATTNDDWMSCGGCHLDGFGSTNLRLFESLTPNNPAVDAQIGHAGLKDFFSTGAMAQGSTFNPHDLLVAVSEQGGLTPIAEDAGGTVDPNVPTTDAVTMATALASVVTRDLPAQPTWAREVDGSPNLAWDTEYCGNCHQAEYAAWRTSVHAYAGVDPMVGYCTGVEQGLVGPQLGKLCVGCHDPVGARTGDFTFQSKRGVTCLGCHDVELPLQAGGNGGLQATPHDWSSDHKAWAQASLEKLRQPTFCEGCHEQFVPGTAFTVISTIDEYNAGPYAQVTGSSTPGTLCVDCHMAKVGGIADHRAAGGNLYLGHLYGDAVLVGEQTAHVDGTLSVTGQRVGGGVLVTLRNVGAGHDFPTGVTDIRQPWVQIEAKNASGQVVAIYGGVDDAGALPSEAARLGTDIATADGGLLLRHEVTQVARVPYDIRVPPGEAQALFVPVPDDAAGTELDAVVLYGVVRGTYFRAAVGDAGALPPSYEMARAVVR